MAQAGQVFWQAMAVRFLAANVVFTSRVVRVNIPGRKSKNNFAVRRPFADVAF
jgi:hypothetical protein